MSLSRKKFAVVGSGPAGLMACTILADAGHDVALFEKRSGLGRKLLIAGSSGLNISHDLPLPDFAKHYTSPSNPEFFSKRLQEFAPTDWIRFIEDRLGLETFLGTSGRYFVREMKASQLLRKWTELLEKTGVRIHARHTLKNFDATSGGIRLRFEESADEWEFDAALLALGSGAWEDVPPTWPGIFLSKGVHFTEFTSANVGYEVAWPERLLAEAIRKPLKNIVFENRRGSKAGELLITEYGLEGTPVYFLGEAGPATLDLKPALTSDEIFRRLQHTKENLSPIRRVDRLLGLNEAAFALVFHLAPAAVKADLALLSQFVKKVPLQLLSPRPLSEAISSRGGVAMSELTDELMLRRFPGVYLAGEMLDWDAPTGGFLIQGSVLQGAVAGRAILGQRQSIR